MDKLHFTLDDDRIQHITHIDSSLNKYHVALGTGDIDLLPILKQLDKTDLPVVVEGFQNDRSLTLLQDNMNYLKQHNFWVREQVGNFGK